MIIISPIPQVTLQTPIQTPLQILLEHHQWDLLPHQLQTQQLQALQMPHLMLNLRHLHQLHHLQQPLKIKVAIDYYKL